MSLTNNKETDVMRVTALPSTCDATVSIGGIRAFCAACRNRYSQFRALLLAANSAVRRAAHDEEGQGTTEYALVVGVLVVVAIAALVTIRGKVQSLWDSITGAFITL